MSHDPRPFDDAADEREWQAQERARAEERAGNALGGDDPLVARYRLVARALSVPAHEMLGADFARETARRSESDRPAPRAADAVRALAPFERTLLISLTVVFSAITIVAAIASGLSQPIGDAAREIGALAANPWLLTLLACLAVSFPGSRVRTRES
jgi:hypothetical protein